MASRRERLRRKGRHRTSAGVIALRISIVAVVVLSLLLVSGGIAAAAVIDEWLKNAPSIDKPGAFTVAQPTRIYSVDGKLLANLYLENREVVGSSEIAPALKHAIVAVEDERFYKHQGWDPEGILRAVFVDALSGRSAQGASTITQQYVRNTILLSEKYDKSPARKIREMYIASEVEKRYSKDQILTMYLNTVYFGEGAYGAEAASLTYFGKKAKELTTPEAAMLAGLVQSPSRYSPYENMKAAKARQREVLDRLAKNGYMTKADARKAYMVPITLKRTSLTSGIYSAPYFVSYVQRVLQQRYSTDVIFKGGLKVYTTLDTQMQANAEAAVRNSLDQPDDPDAALVALDPNTGAVKAMVGGRDYTKQKFNYATQAHRQAGSSFKVFVLASALNDRIPPYRAIDSGSPVTIGSDPPWTVSNSEGKGSGYMSIEDATTHSVNTVFARLIDELGAAKVRDMANSMGIKTKLPAYDSIALGTVGVTPLEMASAYGTLASEGVRNDPFTINEIVGPTGKVMFQAHETHTRILDRQVAYAETKLLENVIQSGTGTAADIGRPAAGKTGTTQNYRDAWFVGYTPQLVTAVWVGYGQTEKSMDDVHGIRVYGGTFPAENLEPLHGLGALGAAGGRLPVRPRTGLRVAGRLAEAVRPAAPGQRHAQARQRERERHDRHRGHRYRERQQRQRERERRQRQRYRDALAVMAPAAAPM